MTAQDSTAIKNITVVGTGVIGNGWITRFLANGYHVTATDPDESAEMRMREAVAHAWPALEKYGLAPKASQDNLHFEKDLRTALHQADFVQENVPEREPLKRKVIADIDQYAPEYAVIASSTSGILPSTLQADCTAYPERVIVAHPFNPVYLMPLVELVGGKATDNSFVKKAEEFYTACRMKPLIVRQEIEGHIADRLMEAIWREALHIINDGVATTEEVDASIVYGPGLRWALMGPFLTLHMGGGKAGMKHLLEQFGPALKLPWTKLVAPELTDELAEKVITGCEAQTEGVRMEDLEKRRDQFLIELQELLEKYWPAANLNGKL
ncbi:L-carnitine dehydrogenase [Virgibacillus dakarensis]|uniref:L-carnitine dehydrogenase n=1 Tax=Lentibacillus populi TaxID=1827502 RepID=A0A9W5TW93_9BACI|nr:MULTISPECIES: 3-hydroxyacyl-CoA dehydrogenase NAD-binding domain-containing protein [Bacillaceae]MBT2217271.1 L-carnitine dehydrogenase [Virgibacillus dakarensis]MTW86205.1 L-carnitine dehydrogenase [Virgibacillus dakarensis]GGB38419.1 L-carnitine dehydrogenase [Lentibacillus populi]